MTWDCKWNCMDMLPTIRLEMSHGATRLTSMSQLGAPYQWYIWVDLDTQNDNCAFVNIDMGLHGEPPKPLVRLHMKQVTDQSLSDEVQEVCGGLIWSAIRACEYKKMAKEE